MPTLSAAIPAMARRAFLSRLAALAGLLPALHADATPLFSEPKPFTLDVLRKRAKALAEKPFQAPPSSVSAALRDLTGKQYHDIRYRPQDALWLGEAPFTAQFFHPGFYYKTAVRVLMSLTIKRVKFATRRPYLISVVTDWIPPRSKKPMASRACEFTTHLTRRAIWTN